MSARLERVIVAVLLIVLAGELVNAVRSDGLTIDEVVYIGAGYLHLTRGDFRLNPEQPPLAKLLGAVPLMGLEPPPPPWGGEWDFGFAFVNHNTVPASTIIARARTGATLLTLLLAVVVWAWSRRASGAGSALVALALVVFHPSLLAHGHLVTTDLPGALTMLVSSAAYWSWTRRPSLPRALLVGFFVGIAVATRITGWLLLPAFAFLEILPREVPSPGLRGRAKLLLSLLVLPVLVIWAAYFFQAAPARALLPAGTHLVLLQAVFQSILPEAYVDGIRDVVAHNLAGHPAYLFGSNSDRGWASYYLVAFLVKNTPGFLLAVLLGLAGLWRRRGSLRWGGLDTHWAVPALLMGVFASFGHIQIGERYILPLYPYLILLIASSVPGLVAVSWGRALLGVVLVLHAVPSLLQIPRGYIPYFNLFAGGSDGGYRVLVDSNLDWGQDLPRLALWMRRKGVPEVQLAYHGSDDPARFGIVWRDLPGAHIYPSHPPQVPFRGTVVVSPNILVGVISFHDDPFAFLRERPPDDRAGVFLVYELPP
jgi:hypothetical protein